MAKQKVTVQDAKERRKHGFIASITGIAVNILLAAAKIVVGLLTGSVAVLADGMNNLGDSASSAISLIGFKMSAAPADDKHPFGHARYEYVAGLIIAVIILAVAIELFVSSVRKIIEATGVDVTNLMLIVLGVSIAIKIALAVYYRKVGKKIGSPAVKASAADSLNDVVVTTVVLVSSIITRYTNVVLDGWTGIAVAFFVFASGIKTLKDTLSPLLGEKPSDEFVENIKSKILKYDGVLGIHGFMAHNYGPNKYYVSLHVEVDATVDVNISHALIDCIEHDLREQENIEIVIHMDPRV